MIFEGPVFAHTESTELEFKANFGQKYFPKYVETICAFMNTKGGHLIFGITDQCHLKGIYGDADKLILRIDSIIQQALIVVISGNDVELIPHDSIHAHLHINSDKKKFVVVSVKKLEGAKAMVRGDSIYYRLGASNYSESRIEVYTLDQYNSKVRSEKQKYQDSHQQNLARFLKDYSELETKSLEQLNEVQQSHSKQIIELSNQLKSLQETIALNRERELAIMQAHKSAIQQFDLFKPSSPFDFIRGIFSNCGLF